MTTTNEEWEPVNGEVTYVKPSKMKVGDSVEGIFLETTVDEKYKTLKHHLKQEDGTVKVLNGTAQLNHWMKSVSAGTKIRIVYDGKKTLETGAFKGTEAQQWKVFRAKPQEAPQITT